jgi:hypothetical protein
VLFLNKQFEVTKNINDCDFIFPQINTYLGSCNHYNILKKTKLYQDYSSKFVFYNLDDKPISLHEDSTGIKFTAMPMHDYTQNKKSNIIMIPLVEKKFELLSDEERNKLREETRKYQYGFIGAISTSGRASIRTQRDFVKNFINKYNSYIEDTTHKTSIFHVRKPGKFKKFHEDYMNKLSKCKFGLCPVGQGLNSYRLGECMQIGVVPIIVGHKALPLENYINWNSFSLVFANKNDVTHENIQKKMANKDYNFMSRECMKTWEKYFKVTNLSNFLYGEFLNG